MVDIEIFETINGYGYRVGRVYQETFPDLNGFVPMTDDVALDLANIVKLRIEPPIVEAE